MTIKNLFAIGLAACLLGLSAARAASGASPSEDQPQNLFISPSGQPFFAPMSKPYPIVDWFKSVDTNGDGRIDRSEFRADAAQFFKKLDRNDDGVLSSEEVYIYEHYIVPEILGSDQPPPSDPVENPDGTTTRPPPQLTNEGAAVFGLLNDPEPVTSADRKFDQRITQKEFLDQADRHFDMLDPKGRGYFVLSDLPKTPAEDAVHARRTP